MGRASLGPAPLRGGRTLWADPWMPVSLTSRHEVVPALDAGGGDSSGGQRPGHGESRLGGSEKGLCSLPTVLLWGPRGRGAGVVAREVPLRGTGEEKGRGEGTGRQWNLAA